MCHYRYRGLPHPYDRRPRSWRRVARIVAVALALGAASVLVALVGSNVLHAAIRGFVP